VHVADQSSEDEAALRITDGPGIDHIPEIAGSASLGRLLEATAVHCRIPMASVLEGFDIFGPSRPLLIE
jgi:hypothetical protein